jgi:hypothetical protein
MRITRTPDVSEAYLFDPNAVSAARYTLYRQNEPRIRH